MSYHGGSASPPLYNSDVMSPAPANQRTPKRRRLGSEHSSDMDSFHSPARYPPVHELFDDDSVFFPAQERDLSSTLRINSINDSFPLPQWDMDLLWDPFPLSNPSAPPPPQSQPRQVQQQQASQQASQQQQQQSPSPQQQQQQQQQQQPPPPQQQQLPQFPLELPRYYSTSDLPGYVPISQSTTPHFYPPSSSHSGLFWQAPLPPTLPYPPMPPSIYHPAVHSQAGSPGPSAGRSKEAPGWAGSRPVDTPRLPELHGIPISRGPPPGASRPRATPVPPAPAQRPSISLILSRANATSIEELPEHKRECPACQLEFEADDYLAVISCCGTAMHAVCISAWVNSQTYAKTKVCMKCRKTIDARRPLNNVVPPVTDKSWDRGQEFTAPESVGADTKIELDVGGRSDSAARRHYRRQMVSYLARQRSTASVAIIPETDVPARSRAAYRELLQTQRSEMDELELRYRNARSQWRNAFEAEAQSASAVSDARERERCHVGGGGGGGGGGMAIHGTVSEINALSDAVKAARKTQEQRHSEFRALSREYDEVKKRHQASQLAFLQRVMQSMEATETPDSSSQSSE